MMHRRIVFQATLVVLLMQVFSIACQNRQPVNANTVGTIFNSPQATDGFVLFAVHDKTYLINNCGEIIKQWDSKYASGKSVYLLENGNLLRAAEIPNAENIIIPGIGGRIELFDWEGNLVWEYEYSTPRYSQHHEVYPMPNGNILMLAVTVLGESEARNLGRKELTPPHRQLYNEQVLELRPFGSNQAEIVWEWNIKDHLIQDSDPNKAYFGKAADNPHRLNINYLGTSSGSANWLHINSMQYDQERDQVVLCSRHLNEIYIIDHSTTTAEAASSQGGRHKRGGDFIYRWGNPAAYGLGTTEDQKLYGPHAAYWNTAANRHQGKIIIFNNGVHRVPKYSEVDIIAPPVDQSGMFVTNPGEPFGPAEPDYIYTAPNPTDLYAEFLSNAQSLPNGNMLICAGEQGYFFEIDQDETIVWEYMNPVGASKILNQGDDPGSTSTNVFRAKRYQADYAAFKGRKLVSGTPIEKDPDFRTIYNCP